MIAVMVETSRTVILRERSAQGLRLGLLIAATAVISYLLVRSYLTDGQIVRAQVVRIGMYSTGRGNGGDLPIMTVRLPDGSIRVLTSSWAAVNDCLPGRWISLLKRGSALQVGTPGCRNSSRG